MHWDQKQRFFTSVFCFRRAASAPMIHVNTMINAKFYPLKSIVICIWVTEFSKKIKEWPSIDALCCFFVLSYSVHLIYHYISVILHCSLSPYYTAHIILEQSIKYHHICNKMQSNLMQSMIQVILLILSFKNNKIITPSLICCILYVQCTYNRYVYLWHTMWQQKQPQSKLYGL